MNYIYIIIGIALFGFLGYLLDKVQENKRGVDSLAEELKELKDKINF